MCIRDRPDDTLDEYVSNLFTYDLLEELSDNGMEMCIRDRFRESGNDYIINLRDGKEKMAGDEGQEAATFMKNIVQYFNDGFAATDYATAQSMFLEGKSAMYYIFLLYTSRCV